MTFYLVFFVLALPFVDWSHPLPRLRRKPEGYWRRAAMGFVLVLALQHLSIMFRGEQSAWGPAVNLALLGIIFWALDSANLPLKRSRRNDEADDFVHTAGYGGYSAGGFSGRIFEGPGVAKDEKTSFSEKFGNNFGPGERESFEYGSRQRKDTASFREQIFESFRNGASGDHFENDREEPKGTPDSFPSARFDPYAALGLYDGAPDSEIRARYRQLAKEYHPDMNRHLDPPRQREAYERMLEVQRAYEELTKQAAS